MSKAIGLILVFFFVGCANTSQNICLDNFKYTIIQTDTTVKIEILKSNDKFQRCNNGK